jgi:hypothetical protein
MDWNFEFGCLKMTYMQVASGHQPTTEEAPRWEATPVRRLAG